jgi:hypothetical protein
MDTTHNNGKYYWIGGIVAILLVAGIVMAFRGASDETLEAESVDSTLVSPYGVVTLKLGETANFRGISIKPVAVKEDSRCAQGVQCVWEGTVKLDVESTLETVGKRTNTLNLGATHVIDTFAVSLVSVNPVPKAGEKISDADYRFTIQVNQSGSDEGAEGFEGKG